jgi:nitrite reductase/ring-hydroxylating ferredoxin subunit/uncharacterized membrane protein
VRYYANRGQASIFGVRIAEPDGMRSSAHFKGHPIHPMLIPFPFAYLFGAACIDTWARAANRRDWAQTARHMRMLGIGSALVAAVPGIVDYFMAVPPKSSAKTRATNHAIANLSALGLFAAASAGSNGSRPPAWTVAAEAAGAALLSVAGWMGGTLVYRNQIAVDHRYADAGRWEPKTLPPAPAEVAIDVGPDDQLQTDQMKLLHVGDRRVVLARTERGYVAFDDRCTHKGGPLSDGALACGRVQCPWHGSQFDVDDGAVRHGPAEQPISTYEVEVKGGRVVVDLSKSEG